MSQLMQNPFGPSLKRSAGTKGDPSLRLSSRAHVSIDYLLQEIEVRCLSLTTTVQTVPQERWWVLVFSSYTLMNNSAFITVRDELDANVFFIGRVAGSSILQTQTGPTPPATTITLLDGQISMSANQPFSQLERVLLLPGWDVKVGILTLDCQLFICHSLASALRLL